MGSVCSEEGPQNRAKKATEQEERRGLRDVDGTRDETVRSARCELCESCLLYVSKKRGCGNVV